MNWTGGRLSRSRNVKDSVSAKQKNFFAKARGRLEHGKTPQPVVQSFDFGDWKPSIKISNSSVSSEKSHRQVLKQKTWDDFENVRPLVQKLETLTRPPRSSHERERVPQPEAPHIPEPIVIGSSPVPSGSSTKSQTPVDDVQEHHRSSSTNLSGMSIESKRHRLLQMEDWVGIQQPMAKPLRMRFADPTDRDLIGKRRKINHRHSSDVRRTIPRQSNTLVKDSRGFPDPFSLENLSVRIGSAVDRSTKEGTIRRDQGSVFSDEILDRYPEPPPPVQGSTQASPAMRSHGQSPLFSSKRIHHKTVTPSAIVANPMEMSKSRKREVLTPSAFMDESSPEPFETLSEGAMTPVVTPFMILPQSTDPSLRNVETKKDSPSKRRDQTRGEVANNLLPITRPLEERERPMSNDDIEWSFTRDVPSNERVLPKPNANPSEKREQTTCEEGNTLPPMNRPSKEQEPPKNTGNIEWLIPSDELSNERIPPESNPMEPLPTMTMPPDKPSPKIQDTKLLQVSEDEEVAWRKFVFGDEDDIDHTSDETEPIFQAYNSHFENHNNSHTQPSLIAEASTSPLKQNPHLADSTFDESTTIDYRSARQDNPSSNEAFDGSTTISWRSSTKQDPLSSDELHHHPPYPAPSSPPNPTSSPDPLNPLSPPSAAGLRNPTSPPPTTISSIPPNLPLHQPRPQQPSKLIYKRPPQSVGERSSDPVEPTVLGGRVLRSGRRVGEEVVGRGRKKGRGKKGEWNEGVDGDDIVDD